VGNRREEGQKVVRDSCHYCVMEGGWADRIGGVEAKHMCLPSWVGRLERPCICEMCIETDHILSCFCSANAINCSNVLFGKGERHQVGIMNAVV